MSAEDIAATPLEAAAVIFDATSGFAPATKASAREFHLGLACALALHVLLLVGMVGYAAVSPDELRRRVGDKSGADNGVSVELVSEADFRSRNTVPLEGMRGPADSPRQRQPAPQPTQQAEPQQPAAPQKERKAKEEPKRQEEQTKEESVAALAEEKPDLLRIPELPGRPPPRPAEKQEEQQKQTPQRQPPPKQQHNPARPTFAARPDGSYPAFAHPPGITRSGENDDFARGVIRALRMTMPPGRGSLGRVTIRFLLSANGNMVEVQVVATTGDATLTRNVVFASRQSSFPFPPKNATPADRTFLVTYIYE